MSENLLKKIFAKNLNYYLARADKSQSEIASLLNISTSTFSSWCTAQKMPRMDSIQALADYFHIQKSDLIEEKPAPSKGDELLSAEEVEYLKIFRAASPEKKKAMLLLLGGDK